MERLEYWAREDADATLVNEASRGGRRTLSYGEADSASTAIADLLVGRGLAKSDVVCVVAGAGMDHALMKLACLKAGLVHAPLSPSLAASETGQTKLSAMLGICRPSLVVADNEIAAKLSSAEAISLGKFMAEADFAGDPNEELIDRTGAAKRDDVAAIYFTSGSTGNAKGVQITRHMIGAVQGAIAAHWPFLAHERPSIVDWLPWHHVFGGLDNFFKMVWNGGAYHVRPAPSHETLPDVASLISAVRPSVYVDVPFGIKLLLNHLENDDAETWSRLNRLIGRSKDLARPTLRVASGYGSTEAASTICLANEEPSSPGEIGVPLPGHKVRLADVDGRTEIRVQGLNVSPGYVSADGKVAMPLDEQGFLRTGDVVAAVRPFHPELGLRFDGRVAEDFKLTNGTRVKVGALRQMLIAACKPYLGDVAIAGETHDYLAALIFPSPAAAGIDIRALSTFFEKTLSEHNAQWPGSSTAIRRAAVMDAPPNQDAGEVNDKGHLVQRRCLQNREELVERLYARRPDPDIIVPQIGSG